ncbi:PRC-barrel domain containing protein [Streptomyces sp. NPDC059982]|uniref:PRC-barrel domain containing protein n=1 Tax=unclassified Streptomyces TaxID=2593676 RepID=UPI0036CB02E2
MTEQTWSYKPTSGYLPGDDLTGFTVEAVDGSVGKVDKHSDDVGDAYLVVDTGAWIFGKEVLLPAGTVIRVETADKKVFVGRTRDQIKNAPEFRRDEHLADAGYREELAVHYGPDIPFGGRPV